MEVLKELFLFLWQLPQNIIGALCSISYEHYKTYFSADGKLITVYFKPWFRSGVSLGDTIILDKLYYDSDVYNPALITTIYHEHGHQKQSKILGPLYLILIGIPSLLGNIYCRLFHKSSKWYYRQPWEAWADKLGGVVRE